MATATPPSRYTSYVSTSQSFKPSSSPPTSPAPVQIFDLQDVLLQYQSQPELLKLILSSKVEEDKRRTEEAKLRAKELDLYLKEDRSLSHKRSNSLSSHSSHSSISSSGSSNTSSQHSNHHSNQQPHHIHQYHSHSHSQHEQQHQHHQHHSNAGRRRSTMIRSTAAPYTIPQHRQIVDDHQERRNSAAVAMVAMGTSLSRTSSPPSPSYFPASPSISSSTPSVTSAYPSPAAEYYSSEPTNTNNSTSTPSNNHHSSTLSNTKIKEEGSENDTSSSPITSPTSAPNPITTSSGRARRKREMQAITKIVETREFPYQDSYFWKNNGNTTQRKTGCKSIYYKCSNSNKGCPVNKTVTERPNGEYIIKYRGQHFIECGRVERIVDL
ncbi:hypothetical protein BDC45DRAFT_569647 [Circinella umbellata]|nr:hypothetical protein BDC45DRAFT_569647 [Circinella umbellata]